MNTALDRAILERIGINFIFIPYKHAIFAFAAIYHLPISIWRKMWAFGIGMMVGCGLKVAGYTSRYLQRSNPWSQNAFLLNIMYVRPASVSLFFLP